MNDKWAIMHNRILLELDAQCPLTNFRKRIVRLPYITDNLLEQMRDRDYFDRKAKSRGNEDDWEIAKYLRNQTKSNIRKAKSEYVLGQLDLYKEDSVIKSVFPPKQCEKANIRPKKNQQEVPSDEVADYIMSFS